MYGICKEFLSHMIHAWYICLHLVDFSGICRYSIYMFHTGILWVLDGYPVFEPFLLQILGPAHHPPVESHSAGSDGAAAAAAPRMYCSPAREDSMESVANGTGDTHGRSLQPITNPWEWYIDLHLTSKN